jgi:hypothetical protein
LSLEEQYSAMIVIHCVLWEVGFFLSFFLSFFLGGSNSSGEGTKHRAKKGGRSLKRERELSEKD